MPASSSLSLASAFFVALAASSPLRRSLETRSVWQPAPGTSWDIQLSEELKVDLNSPSLPNNVEVIDIDLFTNTGNTFTNPDDSKIKALHAANKKVICYFSAGSYEPYRPDSSRFTSADQGSGLNGWPDETWLNLKSENVANIMRDRIALAAKVGCDGIDPDNMDGYDNENGIGLTKQDTIDYFKNVLSPAAQQHGLALGLKNSINIIPDVLPVTQFVVTEQCAEYSECDQYQPYITAGKPVFQIEYPMGESSSAAAKSLAVDSTNTFCAAQANGFSTVLKLLSLNSWVQTCGGEVTVPTTTGQAPSATTTAASKTSQAPTTTTTKGAAVPTTTTSTAASATATSDSGSDDEEEDDSGSDSDSGRGNGKGKGQGGRRNRKTYNRQ
ncbi:hypothetical protein V2G26_009970 [Clonostachys chloroleuca]